MVPSCVFFGKKEIVKTELIEYDRTLSSFVELLEAARRTAARSVNALMTATYWEIGRRIVEIEQGGEERADYGDDLIKRLGKDLTERFGRGFGWRNLFQMRSFYLAYPNIYQTVSGNSEKLQTLSAKFDLRYIAQRFPLSWSHYVKLSAS